MAGTLEPWEYSKMMMEVGFVNVEFVDLTPFKTSDITVGARFRARKPLSPRAPACSASN